MPGPTTTPEGNIFLNYCLSVTLSPSAVTPNTSGEQTFTVAGLKVGDFVDVGKPTAQAGLVLGNARVSAANTLAVVFGNLTAATITPTASEVYGVGVTRPENLTAAGNSILSQIA